MEHVANMTSLLILFAVFFFTLAPGFCQPALQEQLVAQPIRRAQPLQQYLEQGGNAWEGSNTLWLLELRNGLKAVFRSENEPWGSQAEIAGFRFTRWLGLDIVPITVFRGFHSSEWPEGQPWPFPTSYRTGSLQVFVPALPATAEQAQAMDGLFKADMEVVSFVMGRYDNHLGNLLMDSAGRAWMVDFENSLELQQVRYGQFPYARRGTRRANLPSLSALQPFPFDAPQSMSDPSLEQIQQKFSPWWTFWPEGMKNLYTRTQSLPDKTLNYAIWDHYLWIQVQAQSRRPAFTTIYRSSTMRRLADLDSKILRELLPAPYTQDHIRGILERTAQVLKAWRASGV